MQDFSVGMRGARHTGAIAVLLAATLVALAAVFVLAKPSGAQVLDPAVTLTVDETEVGFGAVLVDGVGGSLATRTITVTNTGSTPIVIGGATLTGDAGEILDFTTDINPATGLTVAGSGGTGTFTVTFDPSTEGVREALLRLEQLVDGSIGGTIGLVNEAGNTVTGINLSGTGSQTDPFDQPGTQGCTIVGTNNGEVLTGTAGRDVICALGGNDRVRALGGNDTVRGARGVDVLNGGAGADIVNGGFSKDLITSSKGNDRLLGSSGNDRITDKSGKDKLYGQVGSDTLVTKDGVRGDLLVGGPQKDRVVKDAKDTARSV